MGRAGLEPATSRLSGVRSNHLSYRPSPIDNGLLPGLGGARRDRTDDLLNANQALSQLSYGPNPVPVTDNTTVPSDLRSAYLYLEGT